MADARATLARWHALLRTDASRIPPQHADLVAALRALEPGARDALLLSTLDGLSVARIADLLDEASGTIAYSVSSARRQLATVTPNLREELVAIESVAPESAVAAPRPRVSAIVWLGVPLTIVLVLGMVGAAQLIKRDQPAGGVAGNPSAVPTASVPMVTTIAWSEARFAKDGTIRQLGVAGDRIIALGQSRGSPAGAWYSDDGGETWTAAKLTLDQPAAGALVSFHGLAASGDTVVAFGEWQASGQTSGPPEWKSWVSTDRGATWSESAAKQAGVATAIVGHDEEFLVAGIDLGRGSLLLWRSTDGQRWESITPRGFPQFGANVQAMTAFDGTYIAVGVNTRGSRPRIGVWSSTDGRAWKVVDGAPTDIGSMDAVTTGPGGVLAAGAVGTRPDGSDAKAMMWYAPDGKTWQPLQLDERPGTRAYAVANGPLGTEVLGRSQTDRLQAWFVPAEFSQPTAIDFQGAVGVVALPDRFVSAGGCADAACTRSKVVVGKPAVAPTPSS
jgi:hypothetical protein